MVDAPDVGQQMAQWAARMQQSGQGGGGAVCGMFRDVQFTNFKMPSPFNADNMVLKTPQAKPSLCQKLFADMGLNGKAIFDGLKSVAQAAPVKEASINDITGANNGLPGGGVFAANFSRGDGGGGGIDLG